MPQDPSNLPGASGNGFKGPKAGSRYVTCRKTLERKLRVPSGSTVKTAKNVSKQQEDLKSFSSSSMEKGPSQDNRQETSKPSKAKEVSVKKPLAENNPNHTLTSMDRSFYSFDFPVLNEAVKFSENCRVEKKIELRSANGKALNPISIEGRLYVTSADASKLVEMFEGKDFVSKILQAKKSSNSD